MMEEGLKRIISIQCKDKDEQMKVGETIHLQLVGNEDYINNNIILNIYRPDTVDMFIYEECKEIPKITI